MSQAFDHYSAYYDLVYKDKDYHSEVAYIDGLLKKYGHNVSNLLEFGSGTGIHGNILAEKGYRVHGVELSASMVEQAVASDGFSCQQGDIRSVRLNRNFDAVISLFHVMSYQTTNADFIGALESAASHLKSGGLFIFDFWYTPAVYSQKPETRVKRMENGVIKVTRIAEPRMYVNDNRVDVHFSVFVDHIESTTQQRIQEIHPMRHLTLPELDLFAHLTGFERLMAEELVTGHIPGEDTWGVCVVLRKK